MTISKGARSAQFARPSRHFDSARTAFRAFLEAADLGEGQSVLLPAFVGWSANEGSGVFDPVRELGLGYRFYPMTDALRIDLPALEAALEAGGVRVLVLIHYFGYADPAVGAAVAMARARGVLVLEDEAHAMLSDLVGGLCGRDGDAAVFSLHKMLPVPDGGTLVFNDPEHPLLERAAAGAPPQAEPWAYDLAQIAVRRVENAQAAAVGVATLAGDLTPLWDDMPEGTVPQTFPVVVESVSRDALYFGMNAAGFGVVSLYHTMISEIDAEAFPAAHRLAGRILNLPIHQDADVEQVAAMTAELGRQIAALKRDSVVADV